MSSETVDPGEFARWTPWYTGTSWAWQRFKRQHTEFNDLYWAHEAASQRTLRRGRNEEGRTAEEFGLKGEIADRVSANLTEWRKHYKDFGNWARLSALLAISGYFEVYLKTVASLALESDPGVTSGATQRIDGCLLLKHSKTYSRLGDTVQVVVGEWPARISAYRKLFQSVPEFLLQNEGELERMRRLRNEAGHTFGRSMDEGDYRSKVDAVPVTRLSLDRLKRFLNLILGAAKAIDSHLVRNHIGAYEMVYFYHQKGNRLHPKDNSPAALRKAVGEAFGVGPSTAYCRDLQRYYANL